MSPELDLCGQPIREGEGYGGKPENNPETWSQKLAKAAAKQHSCVVTESHLAEVFGNGAYKLPALRQRSAWKNSPAHTGQAAIAH